MDSLTHNPFNLALDVGANVDVVGFTYSDKRLVHFGVELRSDVFAVERHLSSGLIAKVRSELFDMTDAWVDNFASRDLLYGPP